MSIVCCLSFISACYLISPLLANLAAEYDHSAILDADENYQLYWTIKDEDKTMNFAVEVKTTGWVGFGISQGLTGRMKGADIVIGWVDSKGKGHLSDRHAASNSMPLVDLYQDYKLTGASQDNGITVLKFKRKLKTCDKNDRDIPLGTTKVIYAYGKTDEVKYHGSSTRGARSLNLMSYVKNIPPPASAKHFDVIMRNISVPKEKTTYYCEAFKLSDLVKLDGTRHVIEIAPLVAKKDRGIVHHIIIYACEDNFDSTHLNASGPCYHPNMPDSIRQCAGKNVFFGYGVGGGNFKFPDHVGFPIGASYSMKYFVLETHFDNPSQKDDFVVTSGLRMFYDKPRKHEAGIFVTGTSSNGGILITPKQENWIVRGYCSKQCSAKITGSGALNGNEIKMFASLPHAHTTATGIWTKHVRDGKELPEVIRDDNYDFNYQQTHKLRNELSFKAGDELITYCRYNSMKRADATIGGLPTTSEMCLNFVMYYPRASFTNCRSHQPMIDNHFSKHYARPLFKDNTGGAHNKSVQPATRQFKNWTAITWNETMVNKLKKIYAYNGPDALALVCHGFIGIEHSLPKIKKPLITKKFAYPPDVCTTSVRGKGSTYSICFQLLMLVLFSTFCFIFTD